MLTNYKPKDKYKSKIVRRKAIDYTDDQKKAISTILKWAKGNDYSPMVLSGFAGTGKTTIANDIVHNIIGTIACTAPTHKAVHVVSKSIGKEGATIQKLLGLRPNTSLEDFDINNPQFDMLAIAAIKDYKYVLVDECSMINEDLFTLLVDESRRFKVKLIFIGDPYQLPPIGEHYSKTFDVNNKAQLNEIVRQSDDNTLIKLLNTARNAVKYNNDSLIRLIDKQKSSYNNDKGYLITSNNHFVELIHDRFASSAFETNIDYCRYTAFTNKSVSSLNRYVRNYLFGTSNRVLILDDLLTSYSTIMDKFNNPIIYNSEDYIIHEIYDYTNEFMIKGFLVKLRAVSNGKITNSLFVVDHEDADNMNRYTTVFYKLLNRAKYNKNPVNRRNAWDEFYDFKNYNLLLTDVYNESGEIVIKKDLDYGFGLTVHKTQGSTFDEIFINANNIIYNSSGIPYRNTKLRNRLLYVALSRAKNSAFISY